MLGRRIYDPHGSESRTPLADGLDLLPVDTTFATEKRTVRVRGKLCRSSELFESRQRARVTIPAGAGKVEIARVHGLERLERCLVR